MRSFASPDKHPRQEAGPGKISGAHVHGAEEVHEQILIDAGARLVVGV